VLDPLPLTPTLGERIRQGAGAPASELYLRPGDYELSATGKDDKPIFNQHIEIPDNPPISH
jgi:hypothetical protein